MGRVPGKLISTSKMNFRKVKVPPTHLETSPQPATKETIGRPGNANPDLSSNANTTNHEVPVVTMEIDKPGENEGVKPNTPPPPYSSPYTKQKVPKHLDPHTPRESMHPGLGALKTKTEATKLPSAPKFPPRTSSLGLPEINTNVTTSKIPGKVPLNTTSPTSEYSSPREYFRSPLDIINEEKEEATNINPTLMDWQIDALFTSDDGKLESEDNFEDSPTPSETGSNDKIHSWLAKSFSNFSKPVDKKDNNNSKIDPALLKEDNERQSTFKHRPSKLSNELSTSDGGSNDAASENSTIKAPSFVLPKELEEPEESAVQIYWDGSMWPPENKHEKLKLEEICKKVAVAHGFTEVVIMSTVITCIEKRLSCTVRRIYYEPHIKAVFSKPPPKDDFYPTKNLKTSTSGSIVRRYNLRKPSTKASFDHQEVVQEVALIHVGPNAEGIKDWDHEEKEGWEKLGMWRKGGKEVVQWNCDYDY